MACSITLTSNTQDCSPNIGGVAAVYAANRADLTFSAGVSGTNTLNISGSAGVFKKIGIQSGISSFSSTAQVSEENGSLYYRDEASVVVNHATALLSKLIGDVAKADLVFVVKDMNGTLWIIGQYSGIASHAQRVVLSGGLIESGTAKGDRNGATLNIACDHATPIMAVGSSTNANIFDN